MAAQTNRHRPSSALRQKGIPSDGNCRHASPAVGVTKNGRLSIIMVPVEEYRRLRRRERIAGRIEDLSDEMIEAIRNVEPEPESEEAEACLGTT